MVAEILLNFMKIIDLSLAGCIHFLFTVLCKIVSSVIPDLYEITTPGKNNEDSLA
jgi:hypothetical protein